MLVKELIEKLKSFDPDSLIICEDPEWGDYDAEEVEVVTFRTRSDAKIPHHKEALVGKEPINNITDKDVCMLLYKAVRIR
jgi:hypothetical protein